MQALSDLNDRIALKKGWKWVEFPSLIAPYHSVDGLTTFRSSVPTHWYNPEGKPAMRPDWVGTLEGVSGMLRELNERKDVIKSYSLYWSQPEMKWVVIEQEALLGKQTGFFWSPEDRPGDCVGDAYMSVFGKEERDASTRT